VALHLAQAVQPHHSVPGYSISWALFISPSPPSACLQVAFIDKQRLVTAARLGHQVEVRRDCSVMLSSVRQQQLVEATGMALRSSSVEDPAAGEPEAYR